MKKIIHIALILSVVALALQCKNDDKKNEKKTNNNQVELKQNNYSFDNPPVFRNDGELVFIDSQTDSELFHIEIEVASTDFEKALGLMYRAEMRDDQGMLFLFSREQQQSFYMRNTLLPLDIIYVNSKMVIVDIYENTTPLDETSLPSAAPAQYVVEIKGGLCNKYKIEIGDKIVF